MKIAVIGAGMMGSTIAWDLARSEDVEEVTVADISRERLSLPNFHKTETAAHKRRGAPKHSCLLLQ